MCQQSRSDAVIKLVKGAADARVLAEFLEQSDMRFRLKYVLGDWNEEDPDDEFIVAADGGPGAATDDQASDQRSNRAFLESL